jgi:hypothetical protein
MQGRGEEGIAPMRQGLAVWQPTGARVRGTYFLYLLAEAYAARGRQSSLVIALSPTERETCVQSLSSSFTNGISMSIRSTGRQNPLPKSWPRHVPWRPDVE